jgi:hypothetical protein
MNYFLHSKIKEEMHFADIQKRKKGGGGFSLKKITNYYLRVPLVDLLQTTIDPSKIFKKGPL